MLIRGDCETEVPLDPIFGVLGLCWDGLGSAVEASLVGKWHWQSLQIVNPSSASEGDVFVEAHAGQLTFSVEMTIAAIELIIFSILSMRDSISCMVWGLSGSDDSFGSVFGCSWTALDSCCCSVGRVGWLSSAWSSPGSGCSVVSVSGPDVAAVLVSCVSVVPCFCVPSTTGSWVSTLPGRRVSGCLEFACFSDLSGSFGVSGSSPIAQNMFTDMYSSAVRDLRSW